MPFLRRIALDESSCVYFSEEGCVGEQESYTGHGNEACRRNPSDIVWERIVGIPVLGPGPRHSAMSGSTQVLIAQIL